MIWVQHTDDELPQGSETWQYVPELVRMDSEPLVHKSYGDSFEDTDLEERLAERGVGRLVVTGAQTDACIRSTLHGAFVRGYDVTLVKDAHTMVDLQSLRRTDPGHGHHAHQPLLAVPARARASRRRRRHDRSQLRRRRAGLRRPPQPYGAANGDAGRSG